MKRAIGVALFLMSSAASSRLRRRPAERLPGCARERSGHPRSRRHPQGQPRGPAAGAGRRCCRRSRAARTYRGAGPIRRSPSAQTDPATGNVVLFPRQAVVRAGCQAAGPSTCARTCSPGPTGQPCARCEQPGGAGRGGLPGRRAGPHARAPRSVTSACSPRRTRSKPQQAALDAFNRQLDQANKRFEVGLIAITDVQDTKAARDQARRARHRRQARARHRRGAASRDHGPEVRPAGTSRRDACRSKSPEPASEQQWVRHVAWSRTSR